MADSFFDGPIADDRAEEIQRLREALEAKTREIEAQQDRYLRTVAEFDNVRKRNARERELLLACGLHTRGLILGQRLSLRPTCRASLPNALRGSPDRHPDRSSLFSFRFPQCVSLRSGLKCLTSFRWMA